MDTETASTRWYVVHCRPREERRALENLERQQFSCYLPTLTVERLRQGSKHDTEGPLFPGYLFIRLNSVNDNWQPIRSTRGVIQIVRSNGYPLPVRDALVDGIRARLVTDRPRVPYLKPGDPVRITEGCFAEFEAIFVANDGAERVVLLMNILHREQRLSFPVSAVRKAVQQPPG